MRSRRPRRKERERGEDRERELRKVGYDGERPMEPYEPRASYGGHDFGHQDELNDAVAPKPRIRAQWQMPEEDDEV